MPFHGLVEGLSYIPALRSPVASRQMWLPSLKIECICRVSARLCCNSDGISNQLSLGKLQNAPSIPRVPSLRLRRFGFQLSVPSKF